MTMHPKSHREGYTLLELLASMVIITMVMGICGVIFVHATRFSSLGTERLDMLHMLGEAHRTFSVSVRNSGGVVSEIGDYRTGDSCVVLRGPAAGNTPTYVVLLIPSQSRRLTRMEFHENNGELSIQRVTACRLPIDSARFTVSSASAEIVQLDMVVRPDVDAPDRTCRAYRFVAAPRVEHR